MTKGLAYISVLVLVVGLLLTTCVGSAWSMDMLTEQEMTVITGASCICFTIDHVTGPWCHEEGCLWGGFTYYWPQERHDTYDTDDAGYASINIGTDSPCYYYRTYKLPLCLIQDGEGYDGDWIVITGSGSCP